MSMINRNLVRIWDGSDRAKVDADVSGLQTIDVLHHEIHEGEAYIGSYLWTAVGDDSSADLFMRVGANQCPHIVLRGNTGGASYGFVFSAPGVTASGTSVTLFNKSRKSGNTADSALRHTPTVTTVGTTIASIFIPGGSGPFKVGGGAAERDEWIWSPGGTYLIRVENKSGGAVAISQDVTFYEVSA